MNKLKKVFIWLKLMTKKMLCKWSYLIVLSMIPMCVFTLSNAFDNPQGVVKIALCATSDSTELAHNIVNEFMHEKSIVNFRSFATENEAVEAVKSGICDAAWVFDGDFEDGMNAYLEKKSIRPFVKVYEQGEGVYLTLSREKLSGKLFSYMSEKLCMDFVKDEILHDKAMSKEELNKYFENDKQSGTLVEIKMMDSNRVDTKEINYLKSPLRGILALLVMLCGFASVGFFLKERSDGIYDMINSKSEFIPAFASCFGAVGVSALVVMMSLLAGGLCEEMSTEICAMSAYTFAAASFCVLLTGCFSSFSFFGPFITFLLIVMLIFCPVFFSFRFMPAIRLMLPPYYYLMSLYNHEYIYYSLIYGICVMIFAYFTYYLKT